MYLRGRAKAETGIEVWIFCAHTFLKLGTEPLLCQGSMEGRGGSTRPLEVKASDGKKTS